MSQQIAPTTPLPSRLTLSVEMLGTVGFLSLNIETRLRNPRNHFRFGVSHLDFTPEKVYSSAGFSFLHTIGLEEHHFVAGVGLTLLNIEKDNIECQKSCYNYGRIHNQYFLPNIRLGYRFQPTEGGFFFEAAVTPFLVIKVDIEDIELDDLHHPILVPFMGLAFGYSFKRKSR